jgi:SpoVK/Ycf46/Vps4 family AAA+-type ATPase
MLRRDLGPTLTSFLEARYPFLALRSQEEERVLGLLSAVCRDMGRRLVPMSLTAARREDEAATALTCLDSIASQTAPTVFAMLDFHAYLAEPLVVRTLRDMRLRLEKNEQTIVFVSPEFDLPDELLGDVVTYDIPLPDRDDLQRLLAQEVAAAQLDLDAEALDKAVRAVQGLSASAARRAFRRACLVDGPLSQGDVSSLVDEKRRILKRSELLEFIDTPPALDAVGGLDALKAWLEDRESAYGEEAREFGLPTPKGLLLVGVQGCGKSLTAKAVAQLWNLPLARLDFGALFTHGRSPETNLRNVLRLAEALSPVVLWVDEIDKVFQPGGDASTASEGVQRLLAAFITWLQEKQAPAFVIATANAVDRLPPELLRKGRFDEIFFVDLPNASERRQILSIHLAKHGRASADIEIAELAEQCEHFSGAELEQVIVDGLYRAFRSKRDLTSEDLAVAIKMTVPLYRTYEDEIKGLREWAAPRARKASTDDRLSDLWGGSST